MCAGVSPAREAVLPPCQCCGRRNSLMIFFSECWEEGFLLCGMSSRCRIFLSTTMKIVMGRKETTRANSNYCHRWCLVQDPGLSEEVKAVAVRLGMHEI